MGGAPVELDKRLGGVIASLRERGEFEGDATGNGPHHPSQVSINAKALLLVGLGDERLPVARVDGGGRTGGAAGSGPPRRPPGGLRPAHPRPGKLEVRHGRRGNGGRAGDAAGLRHGEAAPEGGAQQGLHRSTSGTSRRGRSTSTRPSAGFRRRSRKRARRSGITAPPRSPRASSVSPGSTGRSQRANRRRRMRA